MQKFIACLGFAAALCAAQSQGTVLFSNRSGGVDVPLFGSDGTTRLEGLAWLAGLYEGEALLGSPAPFRTGPAAGYWNPAPDGTRVTSVLPGKEATLTVRVWESSGGGNYAAALAAGKATGISEPFAVVTGGSGLPPVLPTPLVGLKSFAVQAGAPGKNLGQARLVWQHEDGTLGQWFLKSDGDALSYGYYDPARVSDPNWRLVGSGDFDYDQQLDFLFQHRDGTMAIWFMRRVTLLRGAITSPAKPADAAWKFAACGDLNGDGRTDILWQHADGSLQVWFMDGERVSGSQALEPARVSDPRWQLVGTGYFDPDNHADLLFQHEDGTLALWTMKGLRAKETELLKPGHPGEGWRIRAVIDVNLDKTSDLVFRHRDGSLAVWFMERANLQSARLTATRPGESGWNLMGRWNALP